MFWNYEDTAATFLKKEINRARIIPRQETLKPQPQNNNSNRTPFVITYNPALPNVSTTVRRLIAANKYFRLHPSLLIKGVPTFVTYLLEALYVIVAYNNISRRLKMQSSTLPYTCPVSYKQGQANYTKISPPPKRNDVCMTF